MRRPISFAHRNLVFGKDLDDVWALYRIETRSYAGLTRTEKGELLSQLAAFAYTVEADFSLLRVTRPWSVERYRAGVEATADSRHAHRDQLRRYLAGHELVLSDRATRRPEVYLSIRLRPRRSESALSVAGVRRWLGLSDARAIPRNALDDLLAEEAKTAARLSDFLDCEPAAGHELQWLIRRAFFRAVSDPWVEERFQPQALIVEGAPDQGGAVFRPLQVDVLRLFDCPIEVGSRSLRVESEDGVSHQSLLCVGALPEEALFPGRQSELLFAPLEALEFPVDACFATRFVGNDQAVRLVRRKVVDADNTYAEEARGDHGPSSDSAHRPQAVRELEEYLTGGERPPLLRAGISLCVSATSEEQLEDRIEALRREYGSIRLHRPLGEQLALFVGQFPAQGSAVPDYDDYLTVEQFGAMVPTATHAVGSETGPYIGHTLSGSRQPVLFDPTEASRTSRAPTVLFSGTLGSGKTLAMELVMYQAFLAGSTVCDIDPKGDHRLEALPGVAEAMEVIELSPDERFHGMLDPLRIGPSETREDLACNFMAAVLPEPIPPRWQTEMRLAVQTVCARGGRALGEVVTELEGGGDEAVASARALRVHAGSGLARLGFADQDCSPPVAGERQVTSLRIRSLTLPLPGTRRAELSEDERIGQAVLRLLAVYALSLTSADPTRHSVLGFDEAWVLLADSAGRALVDRISRLGRAQNVTPLLATQVLGDVSELEGLIGAAFCFGVETDQEARRALELLRLDAQDERLRSRLTGYRGGRCLMRDYQGNAGPVQIDLVDPELLAVLDTTPRAPEGNDREAGDAEPVLAP